MYVSMYVSLHIRLCFYRLFEEEIYQTIVRERMFKPGEKVRVETFFFPSTLNPKPKP